MKSLKILLFLCLIWTSNQVNAQIDAGKKDTTYRKFFISIPYLALTNWEEADKNLEHYEIHASYRISPKDVIGIKLATWKLHQPLGIPLWDDALFNNSKDEWYPGWIREYGIGFRYQRFLYKGLFTAIELMPMKKEFLDLNKNKIADGFRLYTSFHVGYHFAFFNDRFFIEPQIHCNYWPVNSKGPQGFSEKENKWNNYFLFEPNLYIGVKF